MVGIVDSEVRLSGLVASCGLRNPFSLDGCGGDLGPFDCVSLPNALTLFM